MSIQAKDQLLNEIYGKAGLLTVWECNNDVLRWRDGSADSFDDGQPQVALDKCNLYLKKFQETDEVLLVYAPFLTSMPRGGRRSLKKGGADWGKNSL